MRTLGVSVAQKALHAVIVSRGAILWYASEVPLPDEAVGDTLERLLADAPLTNRVGRRPRVVMAIGAAWSRVRRLEGLPATTHGKLLTRVVRENGAAFFLRCGSRLLISDVEQRPDGTTWAAAFDGDLVDALMRVARRSRLTRISLIPALPATSPAAGDALALPVRAIGGEYFEAYAAAVSPRLMKLSWRPEPDAQRVTLVERCGLVAAAALFSIALAAALFAPGLRARREIRLATIELQRRRELQTDAARVQGELARVSSQLDRIGKFNALRGKTTLLLASLAQTVPESTAMVTFRVDSVEGSFVALSTHAADVLPQLSDIDGVVNPRIVGSLTREVQGAAHLERATIRFRRRNR